MKLIDTIAQLNLEYRRDIHIEKDQRTVLIKAAGMFSRPDRRTFRRKRRKLVAKRKKEKDKTARKETDVMPKQVYLLHQNY
jgi:thiamine pyrophosphate-dependent acetolactate synthase large subunit-like protein